MCSSLPQGIFVSVDETDPKDPPVSLFCKVSETVTSATFEVRWGIMLEIDRLEGFLLL